MNVLWLSQSDAVEQSPTSLHYLTAMAATALLSHGQKLLNLSNGHTGATEVFLAHTGALQVRLLILEFRLRTR